MTCSQRMMLVVWPIAILYQLQAEKEREYRSHNPEQDGDRRQFVSFFLA